MGQQCSPIEEDGTIAFTEEAEQQYQQALLDRALDALSSEHEQLYAEALNQLAAIDAPQATQTLVAAARTGLGPVSRIQATKMLWQHALNLQFEDEKSIHALQQLAYDADNSVSRIALQALADMQSMDERQSMEEIP
jgi:hypothetical protein